MAEIDRAHVGAAPQIVLGPLVQIAVDGGRHEADAALAVAVVLLQAEDAVVGERLDRTIAQPVLALRDAFDGAERQPTGKTSRDLRGAKNPARVRGLGVAVQSTELRIATHAPGIEQPFPAAVHDVAVHAEVENAGAFDEKRPAFLEERLERRQVDHGRIGVDLTEIGIHGRVHGDVGRDAVLDVRACGVLLIALEGGHRYVLHDCVGRQLEPPRCGETLESDDVAELRHEAAARRAKQRPTYPLASMSIDIAPDREAKDVARRVRVPQLRQRNAKLRGPAE